MRTCYTCAGKTAASSTKMATSCEAESVSKEESELVREGRGIAAVTSW